MFLYHYQKQKYKAKLEFERIEKADPQFDVHFTVWKYLKLINEDEGESIQSGNEFSETLNVASELAYESHFRQFSENILKSSKHFSEFWTIIMRNSPEQDISRLNDLSLKINDTLKNLQNHWTQMQRYKQNSFKASKLYSDFTTEILNDPKEGKEILLKCKETNLMTKNHMDPSAAFLDEYSQSGAILNCLNGDVRLYCFYYKFRTTSVLLLVQVLTAVNYF